MYTILEIHAKRKKGSSIATTVPQSAWHSINLFRTMVVYFTKIHSCFLITVNLWRMVTKEMLIGWSLSLTTSIFSSTSGFHFHEGHINDADTFTFFEKKITIEKQVLASNFSPVGDKRRLARNSRLTKLKRANENSCFLAGTTTTTTRENWTRVRRRESINVRSRKRYLLSSI